MKKLLSIYLLSFSVLATVQGAASSFDFRDAGPVDFTNLEREISPGLDYASIKIHKIRHSYNPIAYLASLTSVYNNYVITMTVGKGRNVTCDLIEITDDKAMCWC